MSARRTEPSDDAMLTRAEMCKARGISKTTLRRWEDAGKVKPVVGHRGFHLYRQEDARSANGGKPIERLLKARALVPSAANAGGELAAEIFDRLDRHIEPADIVKELRVHPTSSMGSSRDGERCATRSRSPPRCAMHSTGCCAFTAWPEDPTSSRTSGRLSGMRARSAETARRADLRGVITASEMSSHGSRGGCCARVRDRQRSGRAGAPPLRRPCGRQRRKMTSLRGRRTSWGATATGVTREIPAVQSAGSIAQPLEAQGALERLPHAAVLAQGDAAQASVATGAAHRRMSCMDPVKRAKRGTRG